MSGHTNKYLLVKHSEGWNVDRCARWMERSGTAFDWCYPASGQTLPNPDLYAGVIIFGGAGSANDCTEHEWVRHELAFIEQCLHKEKPFFGICLGAQMMARVMGAKISAHPQALKEVGFCEVKPTAQAGAFMRQPLTVMQWHSEGFELPSGATHLAYNDTFPNQAFSISEHTLGVQFHPEVNLAVLRLWHERNKKRPTGVLDEPTRQQHLVDALAHDAAITDWLNNFLESWTIRAARAA